MGNIHTVGPNEALVVSGGCCGASTKTTIVGGWAWAWWLVTDVQRMSLEVMTLNPMCEHVETAQGVPLTVTGVAQCKIMTDKELLRTASEQFLGKTSQEVQLTILQTLEGHLRAILGTLSVEEVYRDRDQFASLVREVAAPDVGRMGIEILSFTIKDVYDDVEYLSSLGKAQTANVKRDAAVGVAQANRDAGIREAECEKASMDVKYNMDTKVEDNTRLYKLQKSNFDREINTAKAEAQLAYELQAAKTRQKIRTEEMQITVVERRKQIEIEEQEIMRREKELIATVRLPAEAESFKVELVAQGQRRLQSSHSRENKNWTHSTRRMAMNKMSKEAWAANPSLGYEPNDLETILGPVFTLFRCFGINFHEPSDTNCRFLHQTTQIGWVVLTLGTCGFRLLVYFPFILTRSISDVDNSKSTMHYLIEFLNYWIYILAVFIGSWCMARWSAAKLWRAIEDMLLHIPLSPEDTVRCRKTSVQCIFGCLVALSLNLILSLSIEISLASPANRMALALLSVVYFYSFGSCALFISAGRIISIAFQTVSSQLELNCCPPSTNAAVVWNYQRQFGIACRAAEKFCSTFGFVLFATVSYTFIGFVNASYNLLKSYQNLPQGSDGGEDLYFVIPRTIKLTYMIVEHLFRLWLICHTADLIRSKALSLVPVLQSIRNDLYSRQGCNDESQEVHTFLLEVSETSPTFGVLGMFTLTKHIIISLIGTTLTYLVVLCQFSTADNPVAMTPISNASQSS